MTTRERLKASGVATDLVGIFALAAIYVAVARFALMLDAVGGFATLVWPCSGIALAALLRRPRLWPGVAIGALVVNWWVGAPILVATGIALGNTSEALLAAYAIRRWGELRGPFNRLRHTVALIVFGAILSTSISATGGVLSLWLGGVISAPNLSHTWRAWWLGDMLGDLVVAPLLLVWSQVGNTRIRRRSIVEAVGLMVATIVLSGLIFGGREAQGSLRQAFVVFPLLIAGALRFGLRGATATILLVSGIAIAGTALGRGPFAQGTLSLSLVLLQEFMAIVAFAALVLGAAIAERAEEWRRREAFLAVVSHDLKSPLSTILLTASLLHESAASEQPLIEEHAGRIVGAGERMSELILDLLDRAALDAGRLVLDRRPEDVSSLIHEAENAARLLAERRSQTLKVSEPASRLVVSCDRKRILQVLANLLGNAMKFTPEGGTITLSAERRGREALFSVTDSGKGIAAEDLPHVFERFWRGRATPADGSGLGLSIARGIVEAHRGQIGAASQIGAGSTFSFTLRVTEP